MVDQLRPACAPSRIRNSNSARSSCRGTPHSRSWYWIERSSRAQAPRIKRPDGGGIALPLENGSRLPICSHRYERGAVHNKGQLVRVSVPAAAWESERRICKMHLTILDSTGGRHEAILLAAGTSRLRVVVRGGRDTVDLKLM